MSKVESETKLAVRDIAANEILRLFMDSSLTMSGFASDSITALIDNMGLRKFISNYIKTSKPEFQMLYSIIVFILSRMLSRVAAEAVMMKGKELGNTMKHEVAVSFGIFIVSKIIPMDIIPVGE